MAPLFRLLALCLLVNLSLPAANAEQVSKDDLDAQKELLRQNLDAQKELLLQKIDSGKEIAQKETEAVGKRIDDVNNRFSDIGLYLGINPAN